MHNLFFRLGFTLLFLAATHAVAQDVPIYTDGLLNNFQSVYSYGGGSDFNNPAPFHNGPPSIAFTGSNTFNAVSFAHPSATYASGSYSSLRFFVHGGGTGGQKINLMLQTNTGVASTPVLVNQVPLDGYIAGGVIPANSWAQVDVPFKSLVFNNDGSFDRIDIITAVGAQLVLYIDDVKLAATQLAMPEIIFADGFDTELLFVPQYTGHSIKVYRRMANPVPGAADFVFLNEAPLGATITPNALTFAPDGNLWVVDNSDGSLGGTGTKRLLRYTQQAILNNANPVPEVVIGPLGANAGDVFDLAFFGDSAYVSQSDFNMNNRVLKFAQANLSVTGNPLATILTNMDLSVPAGLAFDAQGRLWVANYGNSKLVRMSTLDGSVDKVATNVAIGARDSLFQPEGVAFDANDTLWVGNNGKPTISGYADSQLNDVTFGATTPVHQIDVAPGVENPTAGHTGFVGGVAFDRDGDLRANYENANSELEYVLTPAPGVVSYTSTPDPVLGNATTDPGFGGVAFWPVPNSLHR